MGLIFEIFKFILFSLIIVYVSKKILVKLLRKLAEILDLNPKTVGNIAGIATSMPELLTVFFSSIQGLFDTSIYNIISSNVINLIQYIASITINKNRKSIKKQGIKNRDWNSNYNNNYTNINGYNWNGSKPYNSTDINISFYHVIFYKR